MANNKMTAKTNAAKVPAKVEEMKTAAKENVVNVKNAVKETAADAKAAVDAKVEETKAAVAKEAEKKETEKKETVKETVKPVKEKKPGRAAKKAAAKEELKPEVFVQYQGNEAVIADVVEKAKGEFAAAGHRVSSIKSLQVYLKPEEFAAYYVINQKFAGRVDLF